MFQEELLNGERASWREVITILSPGRSALSHGGGDDDDDGDVGDVGDNNNNYYTCLNYYIITWAVCL